MKRLKSWFGERPADAIAPCEIEQPLVETGEEERLAPATLNRYRAIRFTNIPLGYPERQGGGEPRPPSKKIVARITHVFVS
jgi:hypothetical protein